MDKSVIIVPATRVADYHWMRIKESNPEAFEKMQRDLEVNGEKLAFGFNEMFEPVARYVHF